MCISISILRAKEAPNDSTGGAMGREQPLVTWKNSDSTSSTTQHLVHRRVLRRRSPHLQAFDPKSSSGELLYPNEAPYHERAQGNVQGKIDEVHRALVGSHHTFALRRTTHCTITYPSTQEQGNAFR